jgi:antitoxin component YwqK of YwqJK toxin-antitoxin module
MNLCKTKNYLWKITCTPHFQEAWKKYNIRVETYRFKESEVDRLGRGHGKAILDTLNVGTAEIQYFQGVRHGLTIENETGLRKEIMYVGGVKQGLTKHIYNNNNVDEYSYINNRKTGLYKQYDFDHEEHIEWQELIDGSLHGKQYRWDEFGSLTDINTYVDGLQHGISIHRIDGVKREERVYNKSGLLNYTTWDNSGKLLASHKYN